MGEEIRGREGGWGTGSQGGHGEARLRWVVDSGADSPDERIPISSPAPRHYPLRVSVSSYVKYGRQCLILTPTLGGVSLEAGALRDDTSRDITRGLLVHAGFLDSIRVTPLAPISYLSAFLALGCPHLELQDCSDSESIFYF